MEKRVKMMRCLWNSSVNNGGIVCHIRNVDVPRYAKIHHLGEEEAARILRYQVFADAAGQDRNVRIALAHIIWKTMRRPCCSG